ncbi:MAG: sarcosine oxidase subunit alpha, partial [Rhizobiales bacterium]|nr:sarcosine oxidase subunit alpha [Hyphomicrobiales bacterium]
AGTRILVATAHDDAYGVALDFAQAGASIALIADMRPDPQGPLVDTAQAAGMRIETASTVVETTGRRHVRSARIGHLGTDGAVRASEAPGVDLVLMSGGWTPSVHLFSQSRGKLAYDVDNGIYLPSQSAQRERSAGACRGVFALADVLSDGYRVGEEAANDAGFAPAPRRIPLVENAPEGYGGAATEFPPPAGKAFVDFQNDVTAKDLALATREGFQSIEHVKRYTTTGMATDQGKTSNINALRIVARDLAKPVPQVGLTTFRPPFTPVTFGTLAGMSRGALFDPARETPIHSWAAEHGAVFEDVGNWKRAHYFPRAGEDMHAAVRRECKAVRSVCGIFDGSTLGKIEVAGKDAAEFLERMYVNAWAKLGVGRCRYGLMLNEAGFITDDGVVGRIAPDRFHVTTTTGGAAHVLAMMEDYRQTEWPDLDVWLTSVTEQWAVIAVQGPSARHAIMPLTENLPLESAAFPHMSVTQTRVCGVPARLFRVSFTGEAGYEINVPADYGRAVWEQVYTYVQAMGGCAYGTETMHVLRAEKGYIIVGQETDGTVTPEDVGLTWAIGKNKKDFVGKRSLARPDMLKADRPQLVGLLTADRTTQLEEGAQIVAQKKPPRGTPALGHVTSSYWSEAAGRPIALALVAGGRARIGETLQVPMPGGDVPVEVVAPVFVDAKGERLHV